MVFGESKGLCITCLCHYMNHLTSSISLPVEFLPLRCLFLLYRLGGDSGVTDQSRCSLCLLFATLYENQCYYSIYVPPFIAIPRSTEIKSHFSAAEAVIPCCQSPLYCRSCICSCLVLSIDGVGAAGASTGTIMLLHKPAKAAFPYTWISVFLKPKVRRG